jgi:hypothetical protein
VCEEDIMQLAVKFLGAEPNEQTPNIAAYSVDARGQANKIASLKDQNISQNFVSGQSINFDSSVTTSAFLGTNPTGELITSGLPVTQGPTAASGEVPHKSPLRS